MSLRLKLQRLRLHITDKGRVAWYSAGAILTSLLLPALFRGCSPATFVWAGLILQLFGLVLVAIGIDSNLRSFDQDSLAKRTRTWFVTFGTLTVDLFRRTPKPIVGSGAIALTGSLTLSGHASAVLTSAPTTIEGRVSALEADLKNLRAALAEHADTSRAEIGKLKAEVTANTAAIKESEEKLESLVEEQATGDLHLELIGLVTLFFGTLFAGIPDQWYDLCASLL